MSAPTFAARWSSWGPQLRSVLRIVAALIFVQAGTVKLFGFPIGMPPNGGTASFPSQVWIGGFLEVVGGALLALGLFTRPVAFLHVRDDGGRVLPVPLSRRLLARGERRDRRGDLLLRVALHLGRGAGPWSLDERKRNGP